MEPWDWELRNRNSATEDEKEEEEEEETARVIAFVGIWHDDVLVCVRECRAGLRVREKNCTEKLKIPPTYPFVSFRHSPSHLNRSLPLLSINQTPKLRFLSFYDPCFFIDKDEINKEYVAPSWKMRIIHPIFYVSIPDNANLINTINLIFTRIMN